MDAPFRLTHRMQYTPLVPGPVSPVPDEVRKRQS